LAAAKLARYSAVIDEKLERYIKLEMVYFYTRLEYCLELRQRKVTQSADFVKDFGETVTVKKVELYH